MAGTFEILQNNHRQFCFHLKLNSGEIILRSNVYNKKERCLQDILKICKSDQDNTDYKQCTTIIKQPYFLLQDKNSRILAVSGYYLSHAECHKSIREVQDNVKKASIMDDCYSYV